MNKTAGSFLKKEYSGMIKGLAICLMVWHHLFGFPERIHVPYAYVINVGSVSPELILAYIGRICIGIFAFLSGYGLSVKLGKTQTKGVGEYAKQSYGLSLHTLWGFYQKYWIVFALFIPYGIVTVYGFEWVPFLKNLIGYSCSYNAEMWYVWQFVKMVLLFPVLWWLIEKCCRSAVGWVAYALVLVGGIVLVYGNVGHNIEVWLCLIQGIFVHQLRLYEKITDLPFFRKLPPALCGTLLGCLVLAVRGSLPVTQYDFLFVPVLVFALAWLFQNSFVEKTLGRLLGFFGKHSTTIWLTHTFFGYYYFQAFSFMPYYSWLIFAWVMLLCLGTSLVVNGIQKGLGWLFGKTTIKVRSV